MAGAPPDAPAVGSENAGVQVALLLVPHVPLAKDGFEPAIGHRRAKNAVDVVAKRRVLRRRNDDVVAVGDGLGLREQAGVAAQRAVGQHVVEEHGVDSADRRIRIWMHVVVVRDRHDAVFTFGGEQKLVGDRAAQRGDAAAAEIGERAEAIAIRLAHRQHFLEPIVRDAGGDSGTPARRVLDAAQADVEVAARRRLVERREGDLHELRRTTQLAGDQLGDLDVEANKLGRIGRVRFHKWRAAFGIAAPAQGSDGPAVTCSPAARVTQAATRIATAASAIGLRQLNLNTVGGQYMCKHTDTFFG